MSIKLILKIIVIVLFSGFAFWFLGFSYLEARDIEVASAAKKYIPLLEKAKNISGAYPPNLESIPSPTRKPIFGFLPVNEIHYNSVNGEYVLFYAFSPLGPRYAYYSEYKEWESQ